MYAKLELEETFLYQFLHDALVYKMFAALCCQSIKENCPIPACFFMALVKKCFKYIAKFDFKLFIRSLKKCKSSAALEKGV